MLSSVGFYGVSHHSSRKFVAQRLQQGVCAIFLGLSLTSTHAAEPESQVSPDSALEEVIVIASQVISSSLKDQNDSGSRLGITALDTPATVESISGDAIELLGDTNMVEAVSHASGIAAQPNSGSGGYGFAARGFSSGSVTILYDGTKSLINTGSMTYPYDTWNVERIEVLNGPASVLYGGGAIGAAINVISRKPSDEAEHTVRLAAGSFNTYRAALDSTGPINDKLLYRFDASRNTSDGYVQRGQSSGISLSGALTLLATDTLSFTLSSDYADRKQWDYSGMPLINGVANESLRHVNYSTYDATIPFADQRITLLTEWRPNADFKVQNTSYYIHGERLWRYASQFVYQPATHNLLRRRFGTWLQYQNQLGDHAEALWNHEVFGMKNTLSAGFDLVKLQNKRLNDNYSGADVVDLYNSSPGVFPTSGTISKNYQKMIVNQYSVFAEDRLSLLPALSVIAGMRADHSDVDRTDLVSSTVVNKLYAPVSWRVGAVYEVLPQLNVYGQYTTATDPVANLCCISASQLSFDMSEGKQTEIGVKQIGWDGRMEWTLSAYKIVKNKLLTADPANASLSIQVGQQSSQGIEATIAITPSMAWRIEANGTILKAKYDDFYETVSGVRVSRNGNRPVNIPQQLANLWATWTFATRWQVQAGVEYHGDLYANTDNTQRVPSYAIADAGLRWVAAKDTTLDLRASNVFNRFYAYSSNSNGSNGAQWLLGAPRSFEIALTTKF